MKTTKVSKPKRQPIVIDDEDRPRKKKSDSSSNTALVPVRDKRQKLEREPVREKRTKVRKSLFRDPLKNRKVDELVTDRQRTRFHKANDEIQSLIENKDNDSAITLAQRKLLQMTLDLIIIAEQKYRDTGNERAAYALNTLMDRAQQLMESIVASEDRSQILTRIIHEIMEPVIKDHAQLVFMTMLSLKANLTSEIPGKTKLINNAVDTNLKDIAAHLQASFEEMRQRLERMYQ